jgi:hypothetical protein
MRLVVAPICISVPWGPSANGARSHDEEHGVVSWGQSVEAWLGGCKGLGMSFLNPVVPFGDGALCIQFLYAGVAHLICKDERSFVERINRRSKHGAFQRGDDSVAGGERNWRRCIGPSEKLEPGVENRMIDPSRDRRQSHGGQRLFKIINTNVWREDLAEGQSMMRWRVCIRWRVPGSSVERTRRASRPRAEQGLDG